MLKLGNFEHADKIKCMLLQDERLKDIEGNFEAFENCREQGLRLIVETKDILNPRTIAFAEQRNGDEIVIYYSNQYESSTLGYSNQFWENTKCFSCNNFEGAVDYIVELATK